MAREYPKRLCLRGDVAGVVVMVQVVAVVDTVGMAEMKTLIPWMPLGFRGCIGTRKRILGLTWIASKDSTL